jgi:two-component system chemotaxis response regulator CheY
MLKDPKILIVEDSDLQADMLESILDDLGLKNVTRAENGVQAVEYFAGALRSGAGYSLVFLDIVMPEMDGQEALRQMRALEKESGSSDKTTIIMLTALGSPQDMLTALLEGDCTDYIVKPVDEGNIRAMLLRYGVIE